MTHRCDNPFARGEFCEEREGGRFFMDNGRANVGEHCCRRIVLFRGRLYVSVTIPRCVFDALDPLFERLYQRIGFVVLGGGPACRHAEHGTDTFDVNLGRLRLTLESKKRSPWKK